MCVERSRGSSGGVCETGSPSPRLQRFSHMGKHPSMRKREKHPKIV